MKKFSVKKWIRLMPTMVLILSSVILLSYASYSWIRRDWSSGIKQDGITIATGNSLAFVFSGDDSTGDAKSLADLLGVQNFKLKSVSNATGKGGDFFTLDSDPRGDVYARLNHLTADDITVKDNDPVKINTEIGIQYGYVDVMFAVQPPPNMQDTDRLIVYIDPESLLEGPEDVLAAIRISITIPENITDPTGAGLTYIFAKEAKEHFGISTERNETTNAYVMDGQLRFIEVDGERVAPSTIVINGENVAVQESYPQLMCALDECKNENFVLFELEKDMVKYINVRVWAEGEDDACSPEIAGESFDLLLKFSAKKVES